MKVKIGVILKANLKICCLLGRSLEASPSERIFYKCRDTVLANSFCVFMTLALRRWELSDDMSL